MSRTDEIGRGEKTSQRKLRSRRATREEARQGKARQGEVLCIDKPRDMAKQTDENPNLKEEHPPRPRKLRILCLHGFRTSGKIMAQQLALAKWTPLIGDIAELEFVDAPWPASGASLVEKQFEGPYFEWFQSSKDYKEISGLDKATNHYSDYVSLHGPFDGLLGFSQGAVLAAAWMGFCERNGGDSVSPNMKNVKFLITIGGGRDKSRTMRPAYSGTISCASLHLIGDKCFMKPYGEALISVFKDPIVIRHPFGHVIPRLSASEARIVRDFLLQQLELKIASSDENPTSLL
ncbi:unnamed protein product [Calypogeia fissa]